jgi:predicted small secreted protein
MTEVNMRQVVGVLLALCALALAACNTMQGLGKDVEKVGESIQKKAQ